MIRLENIYKEYICNEEIEFTLGPINLELSNNGLVFIMGHSGCGKTTLLNIVGGIDSDFKGKIIFNGKDFSSFKDKSNYRNLNVGYIFQDFNLLENNTVFENISVIYQLQNKKIDKKEIDSILSNLDIEEFKDKKVKNLSGGQKQRVAIARAIIRNPNLIICDEPTGALDENTGFQVLNSLKEISKNCLVLVASHDSKAAEKYADRIINMDDGQVNSDTTYKKGVKEFKPFIDCKNVKASKPFIIKNGIKNTFSKPSFLCIGLLIGAFSISTSAISTCFSSISDNEKVASYFIEHDYNYLMYNKKVSICTENGSVMVDGFNYSFKEEEYDEFVNTHENACFVSNRFYLIDSYKNQNVFDENKWYQTDINGYCEINETNINKFNFDLVEGRLPINETEVAISSYIYEHFKIAGYKNGSIKIDNPRMDQLLNKEIRVICNPKANVHLKIVGVIDTKMDSAYELNHFDANKNNINEYLSTSLDNVLFVSKGFHNSIKPDFENGPYESKINGDNLVLKILNKNEIIETVEKKTNSSKPLVDFGYANEIVDRNKDAYITLSLFVNDFEEAKNHFYSLLRSIGCSNLKENLYFGNIFDVQGLFELFNRTCEKYEVASLSFGDFTELYFSSFTSSELFTNCIFTGVEELSDVNIVGVIDGISSKIICASDVIVDNLLQIEKQRYRPFTFFVDTIPETKDELIALLDKSSSYKYINASDDIYGNNSFYMHSQVDIRLFNKDTLISENSISGIIKNVTIIIGLVFTVLSLLFLLFYFYSITKNETKNFAILKCLGMKNKEIIGISLVHSLCTGLLLFVLSICALVLETIIFKSNVTSHIILLNFDLPIIPLLIIFAISIVGSIMCNVVSLIKITKMNLIKILKSND